jgi:hypothetical protein
MKGSVLHRKYDLSKLELYESRKSKKMSKAALVLEELLVIDIRGENTDVYTLSLITGYPLLSRYLKSFSECSVPVVSTTHLTIT